MSLSQRKKEVHCEKIFTFFSINEKKLGRENNCPLCKVKESGKKYLRPKVRKG